MERINFLFNEFEYILVAFSGGKDSGVMLNLILDYAKENNVLERVAVYHLDYEAQYQATTEYVTRTFENLPDEVEKFWLCLPISAQCACSMSQSSWTPWDKEKEEIWARPMPEYDFVINEYNVPFKFTKESWDYDVQNDFGRWFTNTYGKTAVCVGIRADESLNRQAAITSENKVNQYKDELWINVIDGVSNCYPIYDWTVEDIWIANGKFSWDYNRLYDLFYQAGVSIHQMRVASPFNDSAMGSLRLYKVIEPHTWGKLIGRVNGVNFAGIYGNTTAMGWKSITLPPGHTWKSYMEFLLTTLPDETRENYLRKLEVSKESWIKGGARDRKTIEELEAEGAPVIRTGQISKRGHGDKEIIRFDDYMDDTSVTDFAKVPTYKRMCICIMKNDHTCKYMGFAQTKKEMEKRKNTIAKYKNIVRGGQ